MKKRKTPLKDKIAVFIIATPLIAFLLAIVFEALGQADKNKFLGISAIVIWVLGILGLVWADLIEEWKRWTTTVKCTIFLATFAAIGFLLILIPIIAHQNTNLWYIGLPMIIIGGIGFTIIFFVEMMQSHKEYKESILLADLEEFQLPKFQINEKTNRLYQIYNYNIVDKSHHSTLNYSLTPSKIRILAKKGWTTTLYHINNVIFVNCKNKKHSWWGLCKKFEKNQPIWDLYHEFELYYEESIKRWTKPEILNDTKIKGAEQSQLDPEID